MMTSQPKITSSKKVFFPNLDALRFLSFLGVFLFHSYKIIFLPLEKTNPELYKSLGFLFKNGNLGVNFFFVLSGFLITYLLLNEKSFSGDIGLKNFYIRRILRIWPLFYLCIFIGFGLFPFVKQYFGKPPEENAGLIYYLFFINNFDFIRNWPQVPDALILVVLWSIAVEEQFYLVWPVIVKFIKSIYLEMIFITVIIISLIFRAYHSSTSSEDHAIRYFHTLSLIGDMAMGGLMALYAFRKGRLFNFVVQMKKPVILLIYIIALILTLFKQDLFFRPELVIFERLVIAFFYGMIILEQCFTKNQIIEFSRFKRISKLGIYTYGLYCLHFLVISSVMAVAIKLRISTSSWAYSCMICIVALLSSVLLSVISYHFFEKRFLAFKDKFAVIVKR